MRPPSPPQSICNLLRNRFQRIRDDVRAVLVSVAVQLGPERMPYILHTLRSALPDRGYTSHVIGEDRGRGGGRQELLLAEVPLSVRFKAPIVC